MPESTGRRNIARTGWDTRFVCHSARVCVMRIPVPQTTVEELLARRLGPSRSHPARIVSTPPRCGQDSAAIAGLQAVNAHGRR